MAAILGNVNKFYVKIGSATNYTWLTGEQSNSVNRTQEAIEVSDKSTEWAQFIGGKKGATIDATIFADNADVAQQEVLKGLYNGQKVAFFVGQLGTDERRGRHGGRYRHRRHQRFRRGEHPQRVPDR